MEKSKKISYDKNTDKWRASIVIDGIEKTIGYFSSCDRAKEELDKNMCYRKEHSLPEDVAISYRHESCEAKKMETKEEMPCEWCGEHTTDYIVWKDKANADHYTHNNSYTDKLKAEFEKQYAAAYYEYCKGKVQGELTYW